jgi:hypothetical protein
MAAVACAGMVCITALLNAKPTTEVSNQHPVCLNVKTARSWRGIVLLTSPRAGGAYDSHRAAGIAGCTRRCGGRVAARGCSFGALGKRTAVRRSKSIVASI